MTTEVMKSSQFTGMSNEDVLSELGRRAQVSADSLIALAEIVGECWRRGIDLSDCGLSPAFIDDLRKIDSGQTLPDLATQYIHTTAWPRMKSLPLDDQKQIVKTGKVEVVVRHEGVFDTRKMDVA